MFLTQLACPYVGSTKMVQNKTVTETGKSNFQTSFTRDIANQNIVWSQYVTEVFVLS